MNIFDFMVNSVLILSLMSVITGYFILQRVKNKSSIARWHSLPMYYAWFVIIWMITPAFSLFFFSSVLHLLHLYTVSASFLIPTTILLTLWGTWQGTKQISPERKARESVEKSIRIHLVYAGARKTTRLNSSHSGESRMPSYA